ncbi:MAG: hypothetical protein KDA28_13525, partial [Phycisphaerales bacterium]|nr:hypothetical protein [Phycisphaerales bacterium]
PAWPLNMLIIVGLAAIVLVVMFLIGRAIPGGEREHPTPGDESAAPPRSTADEPPHPSGG